MGVPLKMLERIADLLWPRTCPICGKLSDRPQRYICSACLMRINFVEQSEGCCHICGRSVEELKTDYLCEDCRVYKPNYDRAATALNFSGAARKLVTKFKYNSCLWLLQDFVDWLESAAMARYDLNAADIILPMPTTLLHRLDRGYNPSAVLARHLAKRIGKPCLSGILKRKGHPKRQAGLSEEARRENVKGTFRIPKGEVLQGKTVLLLDDVLTTGSTLSEAARELKNAGAKRVLALTLARSYKT